MSSVSGPKAPDFGSMAFEYGVHVAKKQLDAIEREGKQALELIQTAASPPAAPQGSLGHHVDVKA
jgi:hypothetical protein